MTGIDGLHRHIREMPWSPPALLALVAFGKPALQGRKIFDHGARIELALAGEGRERLWPRLRCAHRKHRLQALTDLLVAVDRAAMQRTGPARDPASGAVKLKLINLRERI